MDTPLVSILIPVYNREDMIVECVDSALRQTFQDIEVIIADNASTDSTWIKCREIASLDHRVRPFRNEENVGPVLNWKRCIEEARGIYSVLLFSDDMLAPAFLERTLPFLEDISVGFAFTSVRIGEDPERAEVKYRWRLEDSTVPGDTFIRDLLTGRSILPFSPGCALFRTRDLGNNLMIEVPSPSMKDFHLHGAGNDVLIYLLTARCYPQVGFVSEPLVFFRSHSGSISISHRKDKLWSRYLQARIWFAENYEVDPRLYKTLLGRAWLGEILNSRKFLTPGTVLKKYASRGARVSYSLLHPTRLTRLLRNCGSSHKPV